MSGSPLDAATIYRWVDAAGTVHLSSDKPPAGVKYERIEVASSPGRSPAAQAPRSAAPAVSAAQAAQRSEVIGRLRNRECVIALESLERLTSGAQPTSAAEIRRLQETVALNCSTNPAQRREQEEMAARLRVANGPECAEARNRLADMLGRDAAFTREQVRAQQQFVDEHCTSPVH
jgi:hypothetical protein